MKKNRYTVYLIAALLTLVYFLFNLMFMQRFFDTDQMVYISNIEAMLWHGFNFFNPHHLHFEISGKYFHLFMQKYFGGYGFNDIVFNLRLRSLLVGSIGFFAVCVFLIKLTGKYGWGILGALLVGFTHGYVYNLTKIDTGIFPMAWLPLVLWINYELLHSKSRKALIFFSLLSGFILFVGIMFHQYFIFIYMTIVVSILIPQKIYRYSIIKGSFSIVNSIKENYLTIKVFSRIFSVIIITIIAGSLTLLCYFYVGKVRYKLSYQKYKSSPVESVWRHLSFQEWLFAYKVWSSYNWGTGFKSFDPPVIFRAFNDSFVSRKNIQNHDYWFKSSTFAFNVKKPFAKDSLADNLFVYLLLMTLSSVVLLLFPLMKRYGNNFLAILLNAIIFFGLGIYWETQYFEFWLMPCLLLCVIFILVCNLIGEKLSIIANNRGHYPLYILVFIIFIIFATHNFRYFMLPYAVKAYTAGTAKKKTSSVYKNWQNPYGNIIHPSLKLEERMRF